MIKEYDAEAAKVRERITERSSDTNIKFIGCYRLKVNGNIVTNSVQETIRIIDGIQAEKQQLKKKLKEYEDIIIIKARNVFPAIKVTTSVLKYTSGYNHYGIR